MTATRSAPRPCPLCGNPVPTSALVEAHVGPTTQHPKADIVVWLCPPCAFEVTDPDQHQPPTKAVAVSDDVAPSRACPTAGPGGWARTRNPAMDGRAPTANHPSRR